VGHYAKGAELYDLLYSEIKDYRAEADLLANVIREATPDARTILDVACGTGEHARWLTALGFQVDGVDLEPTFLEIARRKCPQCTFTLGDMATFTTPRRYDVVLNMFSAIGYAMTVRELDRVVANMAAALEPEGLLIVDPWFEPGQLTHQWTSMATAETESLKVCRVSRTMIEGTISNLEFSYLVGEPTGIRHFTEKHALGLFTQAEMETAFAHAGLGVHRLPEALRTRGLYVGRK
jgi:SAM-dependent methyltransferase